MKWYIPESIPLKNSLIQFIVKDKDNIYEYWGQFDGKMYCGYVSNEGAFPKKFTEVYAWGYTDCTVANNRFIKNINRKRR